MDTLILTIHILVCVFLIVLILLQSGHEGMGVIFGGGSSSMFGSSGAGGLLTRITAILAAVFIVTSLTYNILTKEDVSSVMKREATTATETAVPTDSGNNSAGETQ